MKLAYGIKEFCAKANISRRHLYNLWNKDAGPARKYCGDRVLITEEAANQWLKDLPSEKAT